MISLDVKKKSRQETVLSFLLPVAFFLFQYGSYGIHGIMYTYLLFCCVYYVFRYHHIPVFKPLLIYTSCLVTLTFINCTIIGGGVSKRLIVSVILYLFCGLSVSIIADHTDKDALYKCWKFLGIITGVIVFYQFIQITFLHHSVHAINVLPLTSADIEACDNWIADSNRPVAFFTEPAAVVSFLTPLLAMAQQKRDYINAIIVSVSILLTASTSGLIVLIIMWSTALSQIKFSILTYILVFLVSAVILYLFLATDLFGTSVEKIMYETSGESSNMYVRVIMGWNIFFNLDIRSMLMGIPDIDLTNFALNRSPEFVNAAVLYGAEIYTNAAQKVILFSGIIGASVYIWMLHKLYKSIEKGAKPFFWSVIALMFFSSNFYISGLFVMQFVFLLSYSNGIRKTKGKRVRIQV